MAGGHGNVRADGDLVLPVAAQVETVGIGATAPDTRAVGMQGFLDARLRHATTAFVSVPTRRAQAGRTSARIEAMDEFRLLTAFASGVGPPRQREP